MLDIQSTPGWELRISLLDDIDASPHDVEAQFKKSDSEAALDQVEEQKDTPVVQDEV